MSYGLMDLTVQWSETDQSSWIQIMTTGKWKHPQLGEIQITRDDLLKFKENFDKRVRGVDIAVDVSHNPDAGAVGWFEELRVDGDKLFGKVKWTDEGAELVKSGKYRYFSPEFMFRWTDPATGQTYKDVLFGGALTNRPFLKNMEPVALSETDDMYAVTLAEDFDPDGDGDNDSNTDPSDNPDWILDVLAGITPWPHDEEQQAKLRKLGATRQACDAAYRIRQRQLKAKQNGEGDDGDAKGGDKVNAKEVLGPFEQALIRLSDGYVYDSPDLGVIVLAEDQVTNAHKSPPKGKPKDKNQYADPDHYKYPIDEKHIRAAVSYFNQDGQQKAGGYSDEQWSAIGRRIAAAANKLIGPGHKFENGKITTPSDKPNKPAKMEDNEPMDPDDGDRTPQSPDDTDAGQFSDPKRPNRKPSGGVKMSEQTVSLAEFQAAQERIRMLEAEQRRTKLSEKVRVWMFNEQTNTGKILPAQQEKVLEFMEGLTDEQVAKFEEIVNGLPDVISFGEIGARGAAPRSQDDKADAVVKLAEKKMREDHMEWKEAFIAASQELGVK
jgi:hypothetical protein